MIFEVIKHAKKMLFDNSKSGMSAKNTQDAIDELAGKAITSDNISTQAVTYAVQVGDKNNVNNRLGIRAFKGTARENAFMYAQADLTNKAIIFGINGLGETGVAYALKAKAADSATSANNATTATHAFHLSAVDTSGKPYGIKRGDALTPIYFNNGLPSPCSYKLDEFMLKTGGIFSGAVNFANNVWNKVGDDAYFGDKNVADCIAIKGGANAGSGIALLANNESAYCRVLTNNTGADLYLCANSAVYVSNGPNNARAAIYASAFNQSSSARVKENVSEVLEDEALKILELRPVNYDYIGENAPKNCTGLIAEEVAKILPNCVNGDINCADDDTEAINKIGIDYSKFVPYLIKLVQIQEKRIEELEKKIS